MSVLNNQQNKKQMFSIKGFRVIDQTLHKFLSKRGGFTLHPNINMNSNISSILYE